MRKIGWNDSIRLEYNLVGDYFDVVDVVAHGWAI